MRLTTVNKTFFQGDAMPNPFPPSKEELTMWIESNHKRARQSLQDAIKEHEYWENISSQLQQKIITPKTLKEYLFHRASLN